MVPKSQKVEDWIESMKLEGDDKEVYMKWTVQDREAVMNINSRNSLTMKELFSEVSDPYFFYAPIRASK